MRLRLRLGIDRLPQNRSIRFGSAVLLVAVPVPHRWSHRRRSGSGSAGTGTGTVSVRLRCRCNGGKQALRTCKHCKSQFDPALNHPSACKSHTAHFGGRSRHSHTHAPRLSFLFLLLNQLTTVIPIVCINLLFSGETKRKSESVYTGGTLNTPDSGKVYQYWHCCGSQDPFHPGCTSAPHASYDD
jgi:hypothetical protein